MKRFVLYLFILISPFLFIILVNESVGDGKSYTIDLRKIGGERNQYALNSDKYIPNKCSWSCHTDGCKHKSVINKGIIKDLYFKIIRYNENQSLNYQEMNVILFVFIFPFLVYLLILINIEIYLRNEKKLIS
jgi:hypothetical protein